MQKIQKYRNIPSYERLKVYKVWKDYKVSVMLEFLVMLCSMKEGRDTLQNFIDTCDDRCFNPSFIAQIILAPVTMIVKECLGIIKKEQSIVSEENKTKLPWDAQKNQVKYFKLRYLLRFWYTMQVLKAIIWFESEGGKKERFTEIEYYQLLGKSTQKKDLGYFKDFAMLMYYLPSQFQRWHDSYQFDINNFQNKAIVNFTKDTTDHLKECDIRCNFHRSFVRAVDPIYFPGEELQKQKDVKNHKSWDPYNIIRHQMKQAKPFDTINIYKRYKTENESSSDDNSDTEKKIKNKRKKMRPST